MRVGGAVLLLVPDVGPRELARAQKQVVDTLPVGVHVQLQEDIRALPSEPVSLLLRTAELKVQRPGRP